MGQSTLYYASNFPKSQTCQGFFSKQAKKSLARIHILGTKNIESTSFSTRGYLATLLVRKKKGLVAFSINALDGRAGSWSDKSEVLGLQLTANGHFLRS